MFLHDNNFTLVTDYNSSLGLFGHVRTIPMAAFAHLQQLILAMETYEHITYFFGVEVKNS